MANVSSSNGLEKRPKLRFPGFDEPYRKCRIGDIYGERSQRGAGDMELLSVTMNDGVMPRTEIEGKDNSSEDKSNYKVVCKGDMVYNSMRMWQGANGVSNYDGIVSPAYTVLMPTEEIDNQYFAALFKTSNLINEFRKNSQGLTSDTWNLKYPQIRPIRLCIPSLQEQNKISSFIGTLEERISKQRQLVDSLKKYKRGLSDELFGEKESGKRWMTVPFSEAFDLLQNNTFSRDEMSTENGIAYNIHYGDVLIKYGAVVDLSKSKVPYIRSDVSLSKFARSSYLRNGDIVIADTAEDYTVGKAVEIVGVADTKALSGLHTIPCRPKISFASMYLGYFINSKRFRTQILPLVQGTKVSSISKSEIQKTSIAFPSFEVQSQIASMLYALDHRIDICQACVQGLVRTKEALLQQLFI